MPARWLSPLRSLRRLITTLCLITLATSVSAADTTNEPLNKPGVVPSESPFRFDPARGIVRDETETTLNFNFETGDLSDWFATGDAWKGQPIKGEIDPTRPFGEGKKSRHTGEHWIGGYELLRDTPVGVLTSVPFKVTKPFASFLLGGGSHSQTRVELARWDGAEPTDAQSNRPDTDYRPDGKTFFKVSGTNREEMQPVVVDLRSRIGQWIFIRIVDEHRGGWGHVNFDDFRLHDARPRFRESVITPAAPLVTAEVYPYENLPAVEAARVMQVPEGFRVQAAAAEPDVKQPIAMALDHRGRVWIAEAYEYPQRATPGTGRDRILIFEDTDLDGVLDKRTVFIEGLNLVSGLEVGFGGVWVGAAPYLLFIPDKNGNDVPDGLEQNAPPNQARVTADVPFPSDVPPGAQVLLDGWGWQDTHETLNAFIWGPDGWLYGCHGVFTHSRVGKPGTPDEQRTPLNAGIWRYHPTRHEFEVFSYGTSNPWGVDFDEQGEAFCTACVIPHLFHMIPGARYQRQAGQHFQPHTYADIQTIARHRHFVGNQWNNDDRKRSDDLGGGHAHAGAMIYLGGSWPEEYHGKLFMNNIHGNRMNVDVLIPEGSGFAGDRAPDFLLTGDTWSQMLYMTYGPDGQVYAIDWYDGNQCHRREEEVHDRSNGRIYRISYGETKPVAVDLSSESVDALIEHAIFAKNEWYARHARRALMERQAAGEELLPQLERKLSTNDSASRSTVQELRALWLTHALASVAGTSHAYERCLGTLSHPDPRVRAWAIRIAADHDLVKEQVTDLANRLATLAGTDPSPVVRLAVASALQRLPLETRWSVLSALTSHPEDADDHNLPLMYWYAMEPLADAAPDRALALALSAGEQIPLLRQHMIRRLGSGDPQAALALLITGLNDAQTDNVRLTFLQGLAGIVRTTPNLTVPQEWTTTYETFARLDPGQAPTAVTLHSLGLGTLLDTPGARESLRTLALDDQQSPTTREVALNYLVQARDEQLPRLVETLLKVPALRSSALRAAATVQDPQIAQAIITAYPELPDAERRDARNTLTSRVLYARELLQAVADNRIPRQDLSADLIQQLRNLGDDDVLKLVEDVWGIVRPSQADRQQLIAEYTALIRTQTGPAPDVELGRAVFAKTCQQCHTLFGTGGKVGPDITGSNRRQLDYLLSNVLDPSAVMAKEYRPVVVALADGRIVTGIVKEETDATLTVQTTNELLNLRKSEIEALRRSDKSMMPDDLLKNLSDHEVRSLVAYVGGNGQVAMQATPTNISSFFNGRDLTGWRSTTDQLELWSVESGEIIGRTSGLEKNEFLVSELALKDFRLTLDVQLRDNQGNSGIQFRSLPLSDGEVRGYQADIGPGWWGKLYEEQGRGLLVDNSAEDLIQPGDWNRYEIVAVGSRVQTWLNGRKVVDLTDPAGRNSGLIALQLHSGGPTEVRFRNLSLTLLDPLPEHESNSAPAERWPASRFPVDGNITWQRRRLDDLFRSEGVAVGDLDNDGDLDVAAGSQWYELDFDSGGEPATAVDLRAVHSLLNEPKEFDPKGYSNSFMNYAADVNRDGWLDLVVVDFPGQPTWWFENPGASSNRDNMPGEWPRHRITPVTNNESPQFLDIDGDRQRELLLAFEGGLIGIATPQSHPQAEWKLSAISEPNAPNTARFSHGIGAGDINGDGRNDILIPQGWWEAPDDPEQHPWTFHSAPFGQPCSQMYVYDFDGDGDADVLSSSAHRYGIWWHEQQPAADASAPSTWITHEIDGTLSQTHALVLADINGDGLPDFVTGKRHWAHGGKDPGGTDPALLCWYELQRKDGKPVWTRHQIDDHSGVGTQFTVADLNRDGRLDVVTSNKLGTFLFLQTRTAPDSLPAAGE